MDVHCPHCGETNRVADAPAAATRALPRNCQACGRPLPDPAAHPTASIARQRLLSDSPLAGLPLKPAAPTWPPDAICPFPAGPGRALPTAPPAVLPRPRVEPYPARRVPPVPRGTPRPRSLLASLAWLIGAAGLIVVAGAQAVWQRPELLELSPALRVVAERACTELGCVLPKASDPHALRVQASTLEPREDLPGVSVLRVVIVNRAGHPAAPPGLRLSLVDAADRTVARRTFRPEEYLLDGAAPVPPGGQIEVALAVEAPDTEFAGYRVDLVAR
jgi:hypothetical protein